MSSNATVPSLSPGAMLPSVPNFEQNFGSPLIGTWILTALWGILTAQVYSYYAEYHEDPLYLKGLVMLVWMLGTLHAIFCSIAGYHYLITNAFNPFAFAYNHWGLGASVTSHMVITFFVFIYFIKLAYTFSPRKWRIPVFAVLVIPFVAHLVTGFVTAWYMCTTEFLMDYRVFDRTWMLSMNVTQVIADLVLTTVLCTLLRGHDTMFKRTKMMLRTLMLFAVSRGIFTAAIAFANLVAIAISPDSLWWGALEFNVAELYANALLVTLNSRRIVRDVGLQRKEESKSSTLSKMTKLSFAIPLGRLGGSKAGRTESTVIHIGGDAPEDSINGTATKDLIRCEEGELFSESSRV